MKHIDNARLKEISMELSAYFNLNAKYKVTVSRETLITELKKRGLSNPNYYTKPFVEAGFIKKIECGFLFPKRDTPIYYKDVALSVSKVMDTIRGYSKKSNDKRKNLKTIVNTQISNTDVVDKITNFISKEINKDIKIVKSITVVFE